MQNNLPLSPHQIGSYRYIQLNKQPLQFVYKCCSFQNPAVPNKPQQRHGSLDIPKKWACPKRQGIMLQTRTPAKTCSPWLKKKKKCFLKCFVRSILWNILPTKILCFFQRKLFFPTYQHIIYFYVLVNAISLPKMSEVQIGILCSKPGNWIPSSSWTNTQNYSSFGGCSLFIPLLWSKAWSQHSWGQKHFLLHKQACNETIWNSTTLIQVHLGLFGQKMICVLFERKINIMFQIVSENYRRQPYCIALYKDIFITKINGFKTKTDF